MLAEIAITACDLAEVLGSAIALQLLFGLPLLYGVILTALDTFLLLLLSHAGIRKLESVVLALVATIGVAFIIEIFLGQPDWGGIVRGFVPSLPDFSSPIHFHWYPWRNGHASQSVSAFFIGTDPQNW